MRLLLTLILLVASLPSSVAAMDHSASYVITQETSHLKIGKGVSYYEDLTLDVNIHQIQGLFQEGKFSKFEGETLNMGYRSGAMWFKFSIEVPQYSTSAQPILDLYLSIRYPLLDDAQLYQIHNEEINKLQLGDLKPYGERIYQVPSLVFPIKLPYNQKIDYYLRVTSTSSVSVPISINTEKSFFESQHKLDITNGIYFGITIGLCIYNLFLWLGIRKRVYGLYVFAILNLVVFNATITGYSYQFWPNAVGFQQLAIYLFSLSSGAAVAIFGMAFLKTKKLQPKFHNVVIAVSVLCILGIPTIFVIPAEYAVKLNAFALVTGVIVLFIASIRSLVLGYRPAIYYLIGQGAVLFSVMFTVITSQGIIPLYHLASDVMKWSSAFELIFFSIGLADLVNHERRLRTEAQHQAAKVQKELLEAQVKENEQLDNLVRQRTEELETANRRLEELNTIDELTGLKNRRFLNQALPNEFQRAFREKQPLSVLMFDIDLFKQLNDTYGHQFGDICLAKAGEIIRTNIRRPPDIAFRYGGEEFVVVLPGTDLAGATIVAKKIQREFEETTISDDQHSVNMTISGGIAGGVPTNRDRYDDLLKSADTKLYQAKENGRNQVVCD